MDQFALLGFKYFFSQENIFSKFRLLSSAKGVTSHLRRRCWRLWWTSWYCCCYKAIFILLNGVPNHLKCCVVVPAIAVVVIRLFYFRLLWSAKLFS